jgi:Uma2 family endonuclease
METAIVNASPNLSSWEDGLFYPDSDGKPMANSSEHFEWIASVKYGLESVFADRDDVFVGADLFWYPVKGKTNLAVAPDVMVALGRPKEARKSYRQWNEDNTPPQVVFEFLSESNTLAEMAKKAMFFERYGVQEYYMYDIERKQLSGLIRFAEKDDALEEIPEMNGWKSPRLGVAFDMSSGELILRKPDGEPFLSYLEVQQKLETAREELTETREELTETREELTETREELQSAQNRAAALAAKLRELGVNPDDLP